MNTKQIILERIQEWEQSQTRKWMLTGEKYYRVENEAITTRKRYRWEENAQGEAVPVPDKTVPNNKLAHGFMANLVDDKIAYLLGKDITLKCKENDDCVQKITDTLGRRFQYLLVMLGYETSNKGIGWAQVYLDERGAFRLRKIPSEQCIPLWADDDHTELQAMIRCYEVESYEGTTKTLITKVEYHDKENRYYYQLQGGTLIPDIDVELGEVQPHFSRVSPSGSKTPCSWGRVPFVAFKNNPMELPDIRFVKSLIDAYDFTRSDNANFLEDMRKLYFVLKGYGGSNMTEFTRNMAHFGAIEIDDPKDGGVDFINPSTDLSGFDKHFEQLKRDIQEFGKGINKNLESVGASPSGIALKFLYSGMDIKCNLMEAEFKEGIRQLTEFVSLYLASSEKHSPEGHAVEVIFNRSVMVNETELLQNCNQESRASEQTVLEHHPWVNDVAEELKRLSQEKADRLQEENAAFDSIPLKGAANE